MARIGKKLQTRFAGWSGEYRRQMARLKKTFPVPKDVHDVQPLVSDGYDPLFAVYIAVQTITSVFAECVSALPELKSYYKTVGAAEEEYLPQGPPMSPLTVSYFTTWAFFDFRFGGDHETIGTCLLDVSSQLCLDPGLIEAVRSYQTSRMGIYEHCGNQGGRVRLRELVTDAELLCHSGSGYLGKPGELWYVRLCPPLADVADYYVGVTTPYILTQARKADWTAYLNRAMLSLKTQQPLHELLKYGLRTNHWNEFVFQAYHYHQYDAIFLAGIPDVKSTLPHASKGRR